ncbi:MAG: helix-turn-helix domain-containing protein, partial [Lachnospiraceae bacterium]|nr:helix-turn-helix domain-containing protein [Lachnospiraceae bacterium]
MFNQTDFGKRLREFRKRVNLTQKEASMKIGVSEQALSKWENGECLPDVYHLKQLAQAFKVSVDCLLDTENQNGEKIVETIKIGGAVFELVEKPASILAGKMIYAKDFSDISAFHSAIDTVTPDKEQGIYGSIKDPVYGPIYA